MNKQKSIMPVLFLGVLMGALDIAIVGPALPAMKASFGINERMLSWVFSIYIMFNLVGTPIMAKLSDRFGRRMIYILDLLLFLAGSLIVASIPNFYALLMGRVLQGFGAGGIFPVASAVIADSYPEEKRGRALGLIGMVFGLAFIIGPLLSGIILSFASWPVLFLINVPIILYIIVLAYKRLPHERSKEKISFDFAGIGFLSLSLVLVAAAVSFFDSNDITRSIHSPFFIPFVAGSVIAAGVFVAVEKKALDPVISPAFFSSRQIVLTLILGFGAGFIEGSLAFLPSFAVTAYGLSPDKASFLLLPLVLAMSVAAPLAGRIIDETGAKKVVNFGILAILASLVILCFLSSTLLRYSIALVLLGTGLSCLLGAPLRYILIDNVNKQNHGAIQGVLSITMSIGMLLSGVSFGTIVAAENGNPVGYTRAYLLMSILSLVLFAVSLFIKGKRTRSKVTT